MKTQITLTLESKGFSDEKEFETCLNDVLIPYFDSGEILEIKEIDTEEQEVRADLYRKYDLDDITGEKQENFCN